jgi:hypothetical protein
MRSRSTLLTPAAQRYCLTSKPSRVVKMAAWVVVPRFVRMDWMIGPLSSVPIAAKSAFRDSVDRS